VKRGSSFLSLAVAVTSENFDQLCHEITHTAKDRIELADADKLAELALALDRLVRRLASPPPG
jgi:hypothetical protein